MPKLKGAVDLVDAVQINSNFSQDAQAASVFFRNAQVSVSGEAVAGPLVDTKVVTIRIPVLDNPSGTAAVVDVRGRLLTGGTGRVSLVIQAGGELTRIDPTKCVKDEVYQYRIDHAPVRRDQLIITAFLIAERDAPGAEHHVTVFSVDSIDVTLNS